MQTEIEFKKGSVNIFKDLGLPNPEERLTKAKIASMIYDIIEQRELTQKEAGTILGVSQPKISALRNGRLDGFSPEQSFRGQVVFSWSRKDLLPFRSPYLHRSCDRPDQSRFLA